MRTAVFVVLLSILPALLIIAVAGYTRYRDEVETVDARGERLVRTVAMRQEQVAEVMETLVRTLGRLQAVREEHAEEASVLFRSLVASSGEYANIFLLDNAGDVLASALTTPEKKNFSGHGFFKKALQRKSFSVSRVGLSPFSGTPVLYFAAPVFLDGQDAPGVVCVALDLARHNASLSDVTMPEDASVFILDGDGSLAFAYPGPGPVAAGEALPCPIWPGIQAGDADAGRFLSRNPAGEQVSVIYRKLTLREAESPYMYILYVQESEKAYAQARAVLERNMALFAVIVFLALAGPIALCHVTVKRPWKALLNGAAAVGRGELAARVPEKGVSGEIGMLCREFNAMAEALDRRDRELFAARDQAELSRTAKSEFLATMSHEIRTSMNAILGMAYLVLKTDLTAQQRGYISKLLTAANSLLRVINDILDFSKMEAGKMAMESISFSLRRILGTVRSELAPRLREKKLGFDLQVGHDVPDHLVGDPLRLSQAIMILIDDAVNRSERGVVSLACAVTEQRADQIVLRFIVRDAGVGLTPAQLSEMRELFARDAEEESATLDKLRLRLAIASRLFRMMHGRVSVSSVFGEGVTFAASARFGHAVEELRQPGKLFAGKRALIVDASDVSRRDLEDVLAHFGFATVAANTLDEAMEALRRGEKDRKPFEVVFVDWRASLPDMVSQMARLKALPLASPPPLVLTAASGRADFPVALDELEIDALLPKPLNESLVFDTLMNLLGVRDEAAHYPAGAGDETGREDGEDLAGIRILLAEDNIVNQQIAGEILESEGIAPRIVGDGEEAVRFLAGNGPQSVDIVLMDLQMPVMDGFAATRALRARENCHPLQLPVIAMTAHSDLEEISACFAAGMNDHTGKPIIVDKFLATIRRWRPVSPGSGELLLESVRFLRDLRGKEDGASSEAVEGLLAKLLPVLHEGRTSVIRTTLREGDERAVAAMFAALTAMAEGLSRSAGS